VPSNNANTIINGNGGADSFNVGTGLWDIALQGPVTVNGDGGTDDLVIDDRNDNGADNYTLSATQATKTSLFSGAISYGTIESFKLDANEDINTITINSTFSGDFRINSRGGNDTIDVLDNAPATFVNVDTGTGRDTVRVNNDATSTARVQFASDQDLNMLIV